MDPITIGLAFTAAQQAVGYIKQAIALGKDANSLIGQMGKFFEAADTVHIASIKANIKIAMAITATFRCSFHKPININIIIEFSIRTTSFVSVLALVLFYFPFKVTVN